MFRFNYIGKCEVGNELERMLQLEKEPSGLLPLVVDVASVM